jgi:hypothetical protein
MLLLQAVWPTAMSSFYFLMPSSADLAAAVAGRLPVLGLLVLG